MPADLFSGLFVGRAHGRKLRRAPVGARGPSDGMRPSPNSWLYSPSVLPGSMHCPRRCATAPPARRCRRLSISISTSWPASSRRAALGAIDRARDGNAAAALLRSGLTQDPTRDITPMTRWVTPPRPTSDRNGGRFEIGMGGRFQIGIPGRLHRNPHLVAPAVLVTRAVLVRR